MCDEADVMIALPCGENLEVGIVERRLLTEKFPMLADKSAMKDCFPPFESLVCADL